MVLGSEVAGVDGLDYSAETLKEAITDAKTGQAPIDLLIKHNGAIRTVSIPYHDGLRYPHLERIDGTPALLDELIAAKK